MTEQKTSADRNLLYGIIALQMDFITRDQLIQGMQQWVLRKSSALGRILHEQGALSEEHQTLLDALVEAHLKQHHDDPQQSLTAVASLASVHQHLQSLGDAELDATLAHVPEATVTFAPDDTSTGLDFIVDETPINLDSNGTRFRTLRPHAQGGLGEVYVALDQQLRREVALKEIKAQYARDAESQERFLAEAKITGALEHPGVVPVYGLGTYADGRPYYAMRFIRGDTLKSALEEFHATEWTKKKSREKALQLRKLLRRFLDVCNAISYAHSRGVIHRDLKPSNIMLGKYGETLVVDWGLAKAREDHAADVDVSEGPVDLMSHGSNETLPGRVVGTPAYMSPEQAAGKRDELGPATDVYSLGATLYHLLTGRAPFDVQRGGAMELFARVQQGDFSRPREVDATIPKPLEAICLKAMARQPKDRYDDPQDLAADLENWLADEPVIAWKEPRFSRARRWMRKHETITASTALVILVAVVALSPFSFFLNRKNEELAVVNDQLTQSITELRVARENEQRATETAEAVNGFLIDDLLSAANPEEEPDRDIKLRTVLDRAADSLDGRFEDQPWIEARIRGLLAWTFLQLAEYEAAETHAERAVQLNRKHYGKYASSTLGSTMILGLVFYDQGRLAEAETLLEETLETMELRLGDDHGNTLNCQHNLALVYEALGRYTEAESLLQQTLKTKRRVFGEEHVDTLKTQHNLASAYKDQGRYDEAEKLYKQTLETEIRVLGEDHPSTMMSQNNLAILYKSQQRYTEAEQLFKQALASQRRVLGEEHPETLNTQQNLANLYKSQQRYADAQQMLEQLLEVRRRVLGSDHTDTLSAQAQLVGVYRAQELKDQAKRLYREAVELNPNHGPTHNSFAWALVRDQKADDDEVTEAIGLAKRACELDPDKGTYWNTLGVAHYRADDWPAARDALQKAMDLHNESPTDWLFLAMTHWRLEDREAARQWYDKALAWRKDNEPDEELQGFYAEAEKLFAKNMASGE